MPPGIRLVPGPHGDDGTPAFKLEQSANVGRFANYFFQNRIKPSFSLIATIRPADQRGGYLFSLMQLPMHSRVLLGLKVSSDLVTTQVTLEYVDEEGKFNAYTFKVPQFTGSWRQLGVSMSKRKVTLYVNCLKAGEKILNKDALDIHIPSASGIYIGRAGWKPGSKTFLVSIKLLK